MIQRDLFPEGISSSQMMTLTALSNEVDVASPEKYLVACRAHLQKARNAQAQNPVVNVALAEGIVERFEAVVQDWDNIATHPAVWLCAAMKYFVSLDDEEPDLESLVGFEDDCEVLNACLEFAGLETLKINPEEYD